MWLSSEHGQRWFCGHCGCFMGYVATGTDVSASINTVCPDDPSIDPPHRHIWTVNQRPWFRSADALPRHPRAEGRDLEPPTVMG